MPGKGARMFLARDASGEFRETRLNFGAVHPSCL
jgi:hypothetical protein